MPEAHNPVTFGNAVDLLIRRGILAPADTASGDRRDPPFGRGPSWSELPALRERLATALHAR